MLIRTASLLLLALPTLSACSDRTAAPPASSAPTASTTPEPQTAIGRKVKQGMDQARRKLATENIDLGNIHVSGNRGGVNISTDDHQADGRPKAEITPQGDLLIDGRKIQADASEHALLLTYRKQVEGIASTGMDIGVQGAELGVKAAGEAIRSIFSGGSDQVEKHVDAEAEKIKASARKLCDQLPAMLRTQQTLAASMPEFKPYATMEQSDIDDCYIDDDDSDPGSSRHAAGDGMGDGVGDSVRSDIRNGIRDGIRGAVQGAAQGSGVVRDDNPDNAAAEAETASTSPPARR